MISEEKMKIVINNYFKKECSVNTSIREAFEKGFRIGVSKVQKKQGEWIKVKEDRMSIDMSGEIVTQYKCSECGRMIATLPSKLSDYPFCHCGAEMKVKEEKA